MIDGERKNIFYFNEEYILKEEPLFKLRNKKRFEDKVEIESICKWLDFGVDPDL